MLTGASIIVDSIYSQNCVYLEIFLHFCVYLEIFSHFCAFLEIFSFLCVFFKIPQNITLPLNTSQQKYVTRQNRIRRAQLTEWEVTNPNLCWLAIWQAYREKQITNELPMPQLPSEWDDMRKWARQYTKRHSHRTKSNPYWELANMHADTVTDTIHFLDNPTAPNVIWPHNTVPPVEMANRAAAIMVLASQLPTLAKVP